MKTIENTVSLDDEWRTTRCLNLNAAEGLLSPKARAVLHSRLEDRSLTGEVGKRPHKGARNVDWLDITLTDLAKRIFKVEFAEHRPLSGSIANAMTMYSLTKVGDTILTIEDPRGHSTWRAQGYAGFRGIRVVDIPFDYEQWNIDVNALREAAKHVEPKPRLFIIGTSSFLFPHPVPEVAEIAKEVGASLWYDGSHVLGLIAGSEFQNPIREGAYILTGATSKTLCGPVGGLILHNDSDLQKRIPAIQKGMMSFVGHNRTASLAITLAEMSVFGRDFAQQIIRNAKALARSLDKEGFNVMCRDKGYTESHIVLVNVSNLGGGEKVAQILERYNMICSSHRLFRSEPSPAGLRMGVTELTRLGMKEVEMLKVANFMRRAVFDHEPQTHLREEIAQFRESFRGVQFCF